MPDALAIVELGAREEFAPPAGFTPLDERVYGAARLLFLCRDHTPADEKQRKIAIRPPIRRFASGK